mgnify:CR=1 FL=1
MKRLAERESKIHQKLAMGKMHAITQAMIDPEGNKTLATKPLATTRFLPSTIYSNEVILRCYYQYISALYEYGGMLKSSDEQEKYDPDEYMVVGEDFVIDLLLVVDILKPVGKLMVSLQGVQKPCWKYIPESETLMKELSIPLSPMLAS